LLIKKADYIKTLANHKDQTAKEVILKSGVMPYLLQSAIGILNKNAEIELHSHKSMNEVFYLINGKLQVIIDDDVFIVEPNDSIYVMKKKFHSIKALLDSEFLYFSLEDNT